VYTVAVRGQFKIWYMSSGIPSFELRMASRMDIVTEFGKLNLLYLCSWPEVAGVVGRRPPRRDIIRGLARKYRDCQVAGGLNCR